MNAAQRAVVDSVAKLAHERNEARDLLVKVVAGHTLTSRDDVALVQIPADVFERIADFVDRDSHAALDLLRERLGRT